MNSQKLYTKLLWYTVITIWILLVLHLIAMKFHLYWLFDWFDILMHGLGGIVVGLFMAALLVKVKPVLKKHLGLFIFLILAGTVLVGLLWESLELFLDLYMKTTIHQPSVSDTILDLIMDGAGALVASVLAVVTIQKYGKN